MICKIKFLFNLFLEARAEIIKVCTVWTINIVFGQYFPPHMFLLSGFLPNPKIFSLVRFLPLE